jgi:thioredoxin 1
MESSIVENNSKSICDLRIILAVIVVIILILIFINNGNMDENLVENMSPGVVTQMYAQDAQDTYLKGNVDQLATGNFLLNWNQPTRLSTGSYFYTTGPNRGALLKNLCYKCKKENCCCKNGPVYYPMGYTGDHFEFPTPDINYPLPYIVSNGGFVREGYTTDNIAKDNIIKENSAKDNIVKEGFNVEKNTNSDAKLKLFYADWCGHCTKFKPIFDGELKKLIKSLNIPVNLEAIDCDKNPDAVDKYGITGFPTIILEVKDKTHKYEDKREPEKIIEFIEKHINSGLVIQKLNDNSAKLKLFYADWCGHCTKFKPIFDGELKKLIKSLNIPVNLEAIDCDKNPDAVDKYGITGFPSIILEVKDKRIQYKEERDAKNIVEFIKKNINM